MRPNARFLIWLFFWTGIFLGGFQIARWLGREPDAEAKQMAQPLERDIDALTSGESAEQKLLREAMADPDAVLGAQPTEARGEVSSPPPVSDDTQTSPPESRIASSNVPQRSSEPLKEGPAVEGSRRMFESFASLRRPEVADPNSSANRELHEKMVRMGLEQNQRMPSSGKQGR